jgi:hypothetical protein
MAEARFARARPGFENSPPARKRPGLLAARDRGSRHRQGTSDDIMRPHREFVRAQMRSPAEQAAKIGQLVRQPARKTAKPKSRYFSISWLKFRDRNAHPVRVSYAALHLKLRCIAQN